MSSMPRTMKCVIVGDGKTLVAYATHNSGIVDLDDYSTPMAVDGETVSLAVRTTIGQEDYDRLRWATYPRTDVFLVCYSVADVESYDDARDKWHPEIRHCCPEAAVIVVGCDTDLRSDDDGLPAEKGHQLARQICALKYMECSAKQQSTVKEVFDEAIRAVLHPEPPKGNQKKCEIM